MYPLLLENGVIQIEHEQYVRWPYFQPLSACRFEGLWGAHYLKEILCGEDLSCAAWRESIPSEILRTLSRFPECHSELMEMAQAAPDYYLRMVSRNPAMALLAATYWYHRRMRRIPSIEERITVWENLDAGQLLNFSRFPYSRSFIRTLVRIPLEHVYVQRLESLRELWAIPIKRRLLQHLSSITSENIWLISSCPPILDPAIHELAAKQPGFDEFWILDIVSDLSHRRDIAGLNHWPYRNRLHSWPQLLAAYDRFLRKSNCLQETFPKPPVGGVEDETLVLVPLKSRTALRDEANQMLNCVENYIVEISRLKNYAYRLERPERATVLIGRQHSGWFVEEAMTKANEQEVSSCTMKLLRKWVKSSR